MFQDRKQIILSFFFFVCAIYALRLFYLQVIDDTYQTIGSTGALKKEVQIPLRGQIYDRNGKLLVANVDVYDMYVIPYKIKQIDTTTFCRLFNITVRILIVLWRLRRVIQVIVPPCFLGNYQRKITLVWLMLW